jgi:hypothetical protein
MQLCSEFGNCIPVAEHINNEDASTAFTHFVSSATHSFADMFGGDYATIMLLHRYVPRFLLFKTFNFYISAISVSSGKSRTWLIKSGSDDRTADWKTAALPCTAGFTPARPVAKRSLDSK